MEEEHEFGSNRPRPITDKEVNNKKYLDAYLDMMVIKAQAKFPKYYKMADLISFLKRQGMTNWEVVKYSARIAMDINYTVIPNEAQETHIPPPRPPKPETPRSKGLWPEPPDYPVNNPTEYESKNSFRFDLVIALGLICVIVHLMLLVAMVKVMSQF